MQAWRRVPSKWEISSPNKDGSWEAAQKELANQGERDALPIVGRADGNMMCTVHLGGLPLPWVCHQ